MGPLIVIPFLSSGKEDNTKHNSSTITYYKDYLQVLPNSTEGASYFIKEHSLSSILFNDTVTTTENNSNKQIRIPFAIAGIYSILFAFVFLIYGFVPFSMSKPMRNFISEETNPIRQNNLEALKHKLSPGTCAGGNTVYGLQMFAMIFLFYVLLVGRDMSVTTFAQPIAVHSPNLKFTMKEAGLVITVYQSSLTFATILVSVIGRWVPVQVCVLNFKYIIFFAEKFSVTTLRKPLILGKTIALSITLSILYLV